MNELLRQYEPEECGEDGYPFAWHEETMAKEQRGHAGDGPILNPPIKDLIREQAGDRCLRCGHPYTKGQDSGGEWSPCDEQCNHGGPFRFTGALTAETYYVYQLRSRMADENRDVHAQWRILTVHHLDEDKANCRWWNLAALCQRCHLRMQRAVVMGRPYHYEHSEWFRPYAAGFYAWKYEGAELTREQVAERQTELLAYEHRWTQDAIL